MGFKQFINRNAALKQYRSLLRTTQLLGRPLPRSILLARTDVVLQRLVRIEKILPRRSGGNSG